MVGVRKLAAILAAAMSNLSAALNSLSSTTVVDFYMGWCPLANDRERMVVSSASTVLWALVLFAVAIYAVDAGGKGNVVEIGLSIASVSYGCLLGVFLLGTLTKYATQGGAIMGMVTGFALNVALWLQPAAMHMAGVTVLKVAWTWYVLIGALVTFAVGLLASVAFLSRARKAATAALLLLLVILGGASGCVAEARLLRPGRVLRGISLRRCRKQGCQQIRVSSKSPGTRRGIEMASFSSGRPHSRDSGRLGRVERDWPTALLDNECRVESDPTY